MATIKKAQKGIAVNSTRVIGDSTAVKAKADSLGLSTKGIESDLEKRIAAKKSTTIPKKKCGGKVAKKKK